MELKVAEIVLCKFYFSDFNAYKKRPVLVFKDNLPYNDFIGIAISSQTHNLHSDEILIEDAMLKNGSLPKTSKLMLRKSFIIDKDIILKKYSELKQEEFSKICKAFCKYHSCI